MKKRVIALLLSVVVLVGFSFQTHADTIVSSTEDTGILVCGDFEGYYVEFTNGELDHGIVIDQYTGSRDVKEIVIPSNFDGIPVVGLSAFKANQFLFRSMRSLEKVTIPETVTTISGPVFFNCTSLKVIEGLKEDCEYIFTSSDSFLATPWYEEKIKAAPGAVVMIGRTVYDLTHVSGIANIPEGATMMSPAVFYSYNRLGLKMEHDMDISIINIPSSMTNFDSLSSLKFLKNLSAVNVHKDNPIYYSIKGVMYKDNDLLVYPKDRKAKKYKVPESVESISNLSSDYIEQITFEGNKIKIDNGALSACKNLKKITLPKNAELGIQAFKGTKLKKIHLTKNTVCDFQGDYLDTYLYDDSEYSSGVELYGVQLMTTYARSSTCCKSTFSGCTTLKKITVSKKNKNHFVKDGALYYKGDAGEFYLIDYPAARKGETLIVANGVTRVFSLQYAKNLRTIVLPDSVDTVYFDEAKEASKHIKTIKYTGIREDWEENVFIGGGRSKYFIDGYSVDLSKKKIIFRAKSIKKAKVKIKVPAKQLCGPKLRSKVVVEYKGGKLDKNSFSVSAKSGKKTVQLTVAGKGEFYEKVVKKYKKV